jgi:hypothetical protein
MLSKLPHKLGLILIHDKTSSMAVSQLVTSAGTI